MKREQAIALIKMILDNYRGTRQEHAEIQMAWQIIIQGEENEPKRQDNKTGK